MNSEYINKTIALAGMHLALSQVQQIAWDSKYNYPSIDTCLNSLFARNPDTYSEIFGSINELRPGLEALRTSFTEKHDKQALERARYMVSLMVISKNISINKELGQQVGTTLSLLDEAANNLQDQRNYVIERIAQLYQNTISPLTPRVIVYGDPDILKNDANAAVIRAMLFAGLRSALLWYQAGGSQINLLLGKSKYLNTINQMLD
jgi:high frequency lysogenization protein